MKKTIWVCGVQEMKVVSVWLVDSKHQIEGEVEFVDLDEPLKVGIR